MSYLEMDEPTNASQETNGLGCVLVIDDEPSVRRVIGRELRALGYRALEASSARQGLAALESESVDAIVTDLSMPDMSGMELMQTLQTRDARIPSLLRPIPSRDTARCRAGAFRLGRARNAAGCVEAAMKAGLKRAQRLAGSCAERGSSALAASHARS
jgi:CheY-like chemotaxis protein